MPKQTAASHAISFENPTEECKYAKGLDDNSWGTPEACAGRQSSQPRLRVLHVIDRMCMGGTEIGIVKVIRGLGSEHFEHRICAIRGYDENFSRSQGYEGQVYLAGRPSSGFQFLVGRLARIMRDFSPDIVHSRNWGTIEAMLAARISAVPVAIHSEHGYEVNMLEGLPQRRRVFRRIAYAAAHVVFTVSEELRTFHARQAWLPTKRIRVLPNGVDTSRFALCRAERERTRRQLGFADGSLIIGAVGRLVPIKDHMTLLRAAELLISRGMSVHVLLVGSGPELARLEEFATASPRLSGRVVFAGAVHDVAASLNAMDIFVLPSLSEGMSNTLMEAMASSLPVIATRVGGNPELVKEERSGWLFEPCDEFGLAAILERLGRDSTLRQQVGQAARRRAVQHFSLERMIENYRNLYFELARQRGVLNTGRG